MPRDTPQQVTKTREAEIDLDCKATVAAWSEVYGITREDLRRIIESVGSSPDAVQLALVKKTSHPDRSYWLRSLHTFLPRRPGK